MTTDVRFGTKAETLARLRNHLQTATLLDQRHVEVAEWHRDRESALTMLQQAFPSGRVAVRSSALAEDAAHESRAGAYDSVLDVATDAGSIAAAIDRVVASFGGDPRDQVLVQPMVEGVSVAGVITTYVVESGAPYYVIDYDDETGATDTVTGGSTAQRTVLVHRSAPDNLVRSSRLARYLTLAKELEDLFGGAALDIEFALTRADELVLLQVRRIGVARTWHPVTSRRVERALVHVETFVTTRNRPRPGVAGSRTILGVMPDWNPAEILGERPRPLATSLYRSMITRSVWRRARSAMGYRPVYGEELMVVLGDRPFIDVRSSCNSFLPAELDDGVATKLVDAWVQRLDEHPELHDRLEFDVATTCTDLAATKTHVERHPGLLTDGERYQWLQGLSDLTTRAHDLGPDGSLLRANAAIDRLHATVEEPVPGDDLLAHAIRQLSRCRALGTTPFASLARHAFIGEALLRSAVAREALTAERAESFRRSLRTVSSELGDDHRRVLDGVMSEESFMSRHGHLRPGTYDVSSLRYDERADLFVSTGAGQRDHDEPPTFAMTVGEHRALDSLLDEAGLVTVDSHTMIAHAAAGIVSRERAKHVFTRTLSDALSLLSTWAEHHGLSRDDLAYLDVDLLSRLSTSHPLDDLDRMLLQRVDEARRRRSDYDGIRLGYLVRDQADVQIVPLPRSVPSFVGHRSATGRVVVLGPNSPATSDLFGAIVVIESADPGFDWIFTHEIAGLVTRFGGTNSHMAIRCAEHGLPAAIGCGDRVYARVVAADAVSLDARAGLLVPVQQ